MAMNITSLYDTLEDTLRFYPSQVNHLLDLWPQLMDYPRSLLRERLTFLLAPLPNRTVLTLTNTTEDLDWPKIFLGDGFGAGMSIAQVSHALQSLPEPFFLRRTFHNRTNVTALVAGDFVHNIPPVTMQITRKALDLWVTGINPTDVLFLAYLNWKGWDWEACRIALHAFPGCQRCHLEPSWELVGARKTLRHDALSYLQLRLQVRPWQIHAMLRTQPKLSYVSVAQFRKNMDYVQRRLNVSSREFRSTVLERPGLLRMTPAALEGKLRFWEETIGLSPSDVRAMMCKFPSILQYSVENNLLVKLRYFTDVLDLRISDLQRISRVNPSVWGRSLVDTLAPAVDLLCARLSLSQPTYGRMVAKAPELLSHHPQNLLSKIDYLETRMGWTSAELGYMTERVPRWLRQGIASSLERKLDLLETRLGPSYAAMVYENPSLLVISLSALRQRLDREITSNAPGRRGIRVVTPTGTLEFDSVAAAAEEANVAASTIYRALKSEKLWRGRRYSVLDGKIPEASGPEIFSPTIPEHQANASARLEIVTAGRAFPPDVSVRGRRRSGGMALWIREWANQDWRDTCGLLWKHRSVRLLAEGLAIVDYPHLSPSRPRVSLFACREAVRVALAYVERTKPEHLVVTIETDWNGVYKYLSNDTQLLEWGGQVEFRDGSATKFQMNSDILHPLAQGVLRLRERNVTVEFVKYNGAESRLVEGAKLAARLTYFTTR